MSSFDMPNSQHGIEDDRPKPWLVALVISGCLGFIGLIVVLAALGSTVQNESDNPFVACLTRRVDACIKAGNSPKECHETLEAICRLRHPQDAPPVSVPKKNELPTSLKTETLGP